MDPKPSSSSMLLAPSAFSSSAALRLPGRDEAPRIDARLVKPETREQLVRGRNVVALPANAEHADRHFELDYIVRGLVRDGYVGATDLLTRTAARSDFASDTCVRKKGVDPRTGARYLEELVFEIVNEQSERDITEKAEDRVARGVRRVVAIFVKTGEVAEWSAEEHTWKKLSLSAKFSDPTLSLAVKVRDLLDAAAADNTVARALLAKENPVLSAALGAASTESRRKALAEGEADGLRRGIEAACDLLAIELSADQRSWMGGLDAEELDALLHHLRTARAWPGQ